MLSCPAISSWRRARGHVLPPGRVRERAGSEVGTQASSIPSSLSWRAGDQGPGLAGAGGRHLGSRCPAHRVIELSICGFSFVSLGAERQEAWSRLPATLLFLWCRE